MLNDPCRQITNWQDFAREVRPGGCHLLRELGKFPNSVLVSGCQRSGTTMMVDIIKSSDEFDSYPRGKGAELQGALILSGIEEYKSLNRNCFQVTYLNDCYHELFNSEVPYKLIWLIRNPYSVIYSLIHNWPSFALDNLFKTCGRHSMTPQDREEYEKHGSEAVSTLNKACFSYNSKLDQLLELYNNVDRAKMLVVDYDELVKNKDKSLTAIYQFIEHPYQKKYGFQIHANSISKSTSLSDDEINAIDQICLANYQRCKENIDAIFS